jgi:methyltransferase (TIGR00027 family)
MRGDLPSNTALIVAAGLQLARHEQAVAELLPADAIERGRKLFAAAHPRMAALLLKPWFVRAARWLERLTLRGIVLHFALRKRRLRVHAHAAIVGGCRQVVVLGAGFDTLCMELLAAHPQLRCIEIDHPATQRVKRGAAGSDGEGICFVGADLARQPLAGVLAASPGFDPGAATLFVAEGLLMYVPLPAVADLFGQMAEAAPNSQVAFTWLEPQRDGKPNFRRASRLVDGWLALRGEPFLSGMARAALPGFLERAGFVLSEVAESGDQLRSADRIALGAAGMPIAGEYIALAATRR